MPRDLRIWPAADAKLRKRWAAGVPCAQIGRELGVSSAAVIGRAKRLGLGRHPHARACISVYRELRGLDGRMRIGQYPEGDAADPMENVD